MLVVVGSATIPDSEHVPKEISAHHRGRARWRFRRSRIVPINVDGALSAFQDECPPRYVGTGWEPLAKRAAEPESTTALVAGTPSPDVIDRIRHSCSAMCAETMLWGTAAVIAAAVLGGFLWQVRTLRANAADLTNKNAASAAKLATTQTRLGEVTEQLGSVNGKLETSQKRLDEFENISTRLTPS